MIIFLLDATQMSNKLGVERQPAIVEIYVQWQNSGQDILPQNLHSLSPSGEHGFVVVADVLEPEQARKPWVKRGQTAERFGMFFPGNKISGE